MLFTIPCISPKKVSFPEYPLLTKFFYDEVLKEEELAGPATLGDGGGMHDPLVFGLATKKKRNKEKKNSFKAEIMKRLSQGSKCYCISKLQSI